MCLARIALQVFARLHSGSAVCEEGGGVRRRLEYVESRQNASWTRKGPLSSDVCCIFTIFYTAASLPLVRLPLTPLSPLSFANALPNYTRSLAQVLFHSSNQSLGSVCPHRPRVMNPPCREVVTQCNSRLSAEC